MSDKACKILMWSCITVLVVALLGMIWFSMVVDTSHALTVQGGDSTAVQGPKASAALASGCLTIEGGSGNILIEPTGSGCILVEN